LTVTAVGSSDDGTATIVDNQVVFTPNTNFYGWLDDTISYTISNGVGTASAAFNVYVLYSGPSAGNVGAATDINTAVTVNVFTDDSSAEGFTLTVTAVGDPTNGSASIVDNEVVYTPDTNTYGWDGFTYTISDGISTASAEVNVDVLYYPPYAANDSGETVSNVPVTLDVLANDSDPESYGLTITAVGDPSNGTASIVDNASIQGVILRTVAIETLV
jgi:predicted RNA-binding protein with TRAM domain